MADTKPDSGLFRLSTASGLKVEVNANGSLRRFDCEALCLALFVGNELEGGPTNIFLRHRGKQVGTTGGTASSTPPWTPLLGPLSPTRWQLDGSNKLVGAGTWRGIDYSIALVLAQGAKAWFWHIRLENTDSAAQDVDLTYAQDISLASYGGIRLNEYYVSQYLDHTPLRHPKHGHMIATRQNLAVDGRIPWCLIGSLREGSSFATDAKQLHGLATRAGDPPAGLVGDLPSKRLQHEHAMVVIRDSVLHLEPRKAVDAGFFGLHVPHHPEATSPADIERAAEVLALPEVKAPASTKAAPKTDFATLFSSAPLLATRDLTSSELDQLFGRQRRHEEKDDQGELLSFFHDANHHVVLRAKELRVLRPHGHILRTGRHTTPDETALTSTAYMNGVFHSMVTQGHVSINRFLSTTHTYLGLFRSHGQRVFAQLGDKWHLLNVPSAFEMTPDACRWIYAYDGGLIEVRAEAHSDPQELILTLSGPSVRFLISHHVALNDDDGSALGSAIWRLDHGKVVLSPPPNTELGRRFPSGCFHIEPLTGTQFQQVGGDEMLFADQRSRQQPFVCIVTPPAASVGLKIKGLLVPPEATPPLQVDQLIPTLGVSGGSGEAAKRVTHVADIIPWFIHNALVHYLSPRGLEQYSGGGWGTRDVCQGPVEMLLALDRPAPIRDLLIRVMKQQNPDGDWPQWFMFFERERGIRPGDSHGDIVFWPLVVLAQYLIASGDSAVLDEKVRFFDSKGFDAGEQATLWQHTQRALELIGKRLIPGTSLISYGHGDWNDSLQPADPALREHMCSAWTVTLHFQTLNLLAHALRSIGRPQDAEPLETQAQAVHKDFQRLLLVDGVLTGYAIFDGGERPRYLLHPDDKVTGLKYSSLAMIHAILEDMLTPEQARQHLALIDKHLSTSDGVRLFDHPMPYHGGTMQIFQRAETATYFGREIGLMYTHAHLRYAQALAHVGEAERFFHALCQANPIGIRSIVPTATLRQANCYYSSSDAAFEDRYQASAEYDRVASGTIALDGGWRVYSSGAGIALGLTIRRFLGLSCEARALRVDPVIPSSLDGLQVDTTLRGRPLKVQYRIGKSGHGVTEVTLNGQKLPFTTEPNPHRVGAALVDLQAALSSLRADQNELMVRLG
jgi:1,2-beta-oligoglucan phosphorylase